MFVIEYYYTIHNVWVSQLSLFFSLLLLLLLLLLLQLRCENILRSNPESRLAKELHLASIESQEQRDKRKMREAAIGGVTAAAAVGVAAGIASLLLSKR